MECQHCGAPMPSEAIRVSHEARFCPSKDSKDDMQATLPEQEHTRLETPEADPLYFVDEKVLQEVERVITMADAGQPQNLAIVGPHGSGKTSLAKQVAAKRGSPTYIANAYMQRSSDEWFGREGVSMVHGTFYIPSIFVEAIETPGSTIIINDLALMQNKSVQNGLNDLLDDSLREAWVDQLAATLGRPVRVAKKVIIIATWNEGNRYTGNISLSANLVDRFPNRIYMPYPIPIVQIKVLFTKTGLEVSECKRLVAFGQALRGLSEPIEISMRGLLQSAIKMKLGASLRDALYFSIIGGLSPENQEAALMTLDGLWTIEEKTEASRDSQWVAWGVRNGTPV